MRWLIVGLTLFFLLAALRSHWAEVTQVRLDRRGWGLLGLALLLISASHVWSAGIWALILRLFRVRIGFWTAIALYLQTNLAKYLPGNIWHFYGRMLKVVESGSPWGVASLSVLLEPLLLAAAAAIAMILGLGGDLWQISGLPLLKFLVPLGLMGVLGGLHPRFFNPVIQKVSKGKTQNHDPIQLTWYPWQPLLGELVFIALRGAGFLCVWAAITPLTLSQIPSLLGVFSGAWLAGFIIPGAPGGLGVFEFVALNLLEIVGDRQVSTGSLLTIIALLRLISTLAELIPLPFFSVNSKQ